MHIVLNSQMQRYSSGLNIMHISRFDIILILKIEIYFYFYLMLHINLFVLNKNFKILII